MNKHYNNVKFIILLCLSAKKGFKKLINIIINKTKYNTNTSLLLNKDDTKQEEQ